MNYKWHREFTNNDELEVSQTKKKCSGVKMRKWFYKLKVNSEELRKKMSKPWFTEGKEHI